MKIKKLTIDEKEIATAVEAYLKTQGVNMPVHSVSKPYNYSTEYEVVFKFEVDDAVPPKPTSSEEPL